MFLFRSSNAEKTHRYETGRRAVVFLCVIIFQAILQSAEGILDAEPAVERQRLRSDLLKNYNRNRRPVLDQKQKCNISVFYHVQHILGLDEKDQVLSVNGQLAMLWTDQFLTWDPNSYSGISEVYFPSKEVWLPDLMAVHNVRPMEIYDKLRSPPVYVSSNGSVQWCPEVRFDFPCSADYRHYPFDSHNCSVLIDTSDLGSSKFILSTEWRPFNQSKMVQGTEWALKDVVNAVEFFEIRKKFRFYKLRITIQLERMSHMYRYVCVIPTLISMVTLLSGFWLLPNEATRYVIGCANVIVLSMLLQHLAATVPAGRVVPLIAQYSASCLCLSAIFVIVTVVSNLLRTANGTAPSALVRFAHFSVERYLCIFTFSHVSGEEQISEATPPGSTSLSPDELMRRRDWYIVSVLVDRLAFWCFVFIFVVLLAVLASV